MASHPTIADVKAAIARANLARQRAQAARDASALVAAVRRQLAAKRRAGMLLDADTSSADDLGKSTEQCRALARLSDEQFRAKAEAVARRAVGFMEARRAGGPLPGIRMALTPWFRDSDGLMTRRLTPADDEGAEANGAA